MLTPDLESIIQIPPKIIKTIFKIKPLKTNPEKHKKDA